MVRHGITTFDERRNNFPDLLTLPSTLRIAEIGNLIHDFVDSLKLNGIKDEEIVLILTSLITELGDGSPSQVELPRWVD